MSVQGYSPAAILSAYSLAIPVEYTYVAAITMVIYDSIIMFQQERECIYKRRQTLIKWIYILIKLVGLTILVINFAAYVIPPQTPTLCLVRQWFANFLFEVVDTAVIKTLLVLRLRTLYYDNRFVTTFLWSLTAVELISATYAYALTGLVFHQSIVSSAPIPGCPLQPENLLLHFQTAAVVWATRLATNSLELIFLLFGLYKCLKDTDNLSRTGWPRLRQVAPILYVFYRDGTIFYIPICALSIFGLVATITDLTLEFTCSNWEAWLSITYYIVGTRLILNIRQEGLKFSTGMITKQKISTLAFHAPDEEDLDMEDAVMSVDGPGFPSPGVHKTTRDMRGSSGSG